MARINIEDNLHADVRFKRLVREVGCEDRAIGMLYRFWRQAQDAWGNGNLIPLNDFLLDGFEPILRVGLAQQRDTEVYAVGSEIRFHWYLQRKNAAKASVKSRKQRANKKPTERQPRSNEKAIPNQPLSLSLSPTLTLSQKEKGKNAPATQAPPLPVPKPKKVDGKDIARFIATYCEAYKHRYGANPPIGGKGAGIAGRLVGDHGVERACQLVQAYLQISDDWFLKKYHDLPTLEANLNKVSTAIATGREDPNKTASWERTVREFMAETEGDEVGTAVVHGSNA